METVRNGKRYIEENCGRVLIYVEDQKAWTPCGNLNYNTNMEMTLEEFLDKYSEFH